MGDEIFEQRVKSFSDFLKHLLNQKEFFELEWQDS